MRLKDSKFYDPGLNNTGISASDYRKEYTRLYTNYQKRMGALQRNGFSWTETYKDFKGIPKPSELKTSRGIRNNLKSLYDFFQDPLTSTRNQQSLRRDVIEQFNDKGIPLKKSEYKNFMQFLDWVRQTVPGLSMVSGQIYNAWQQAQNGAPEKNMKTIYITFLKQQGIKYKEEELFKRKKNNK